RGIMEKVEALVTEVSFRNDENGFTVLQIRLDDGRRVAAVGVLPELASGERVALSGDWMEHPQYGTQLRTNFCEVIRPTTARGVERYLASGLIKGVGPSTAKQIIEHFGDAALDVMQYNPERLREIPGIGAKRAKQIGESFQQQHEMRSAMVFLQSYGLSPALAMKVWKRYGERAQAVIRENPYRLAEEIEGVGFVTADRIALSLGIAPNAPARVRAGLLYALSEAASAGGHTYLPREMLLYQAARLLNVPEELTETALSALLIEQLLIARDMEEHTAIYPPHAYRAELETARRLLELHAALPYRDDPKLGRLIAQWQSRADIALNSEQVRAVRAAVTEGVSVITGGPGTGKTTIIRCILSLLGDAEVLLAAPTGRAAKRMSEATGREAKTLHRLLEYGGDENTFAKNAENPIETDALIVDEMSMVDVFLMRSLLRALSPGTRLILVGDADQLPSVGAGHVLGDILASDALPFVRLTEIYRQDAASMIVVNAHRINRGEAPVLNSRGSDFFLERCQIGDAAERIAELVAVRLPRYLQVDAMRDIQVLSPTKKGDAGVWALNRLLQQRLNPPQEGQPERAFRDSLFRIGDKVMQTRNDYQMAWSRGRGEEGQGVFNGDMGLVIALDNEERTLTVRFDDDREAVYEDAQLEDLELAYCVSVHKSQGSEFPAVVMPVVGGPPMLLTRNLFYTAVTRARRMVVLVGREDAVGRMVANAQIARRYSGLERWLRGDMA
ncbi:MAG: ATP-dependent RecD-like DNA helicase, partial [Oscillospiraceae bacterium]|nr:ATP-dependent RecD-like DNA helicase [Oscillospiraceae bacterium]